MYVCMCVYVWRRWGGDKVRKSEECRLRLKLPGSSKSPLDQIASMCMQVHKCLGIISVSSSIQ